MNILLQQLAQAVQQYPWQEKLLVVPSRTYGYQLMAGLARQGTPWLNLRPVTPLGLALEIGGDDLTRRGLQIASRYQSLGLLEEIVAFMGTRGELGYFKTINEVGLLSGLLLRSLRDLRLSGLKIEDIEPGAFVDSQKGREMQAIFNQYDLALEANQLVDEVEVYERALALVADEPDAAPPWMLLIPEQLGLSPSAYRFLERFQGVSRVLAQDPVIGLANPVKGRFQLADAVQPPPESSLSYIFEPAANHLDPAEVQIFQAYGEAAEVREVLRRIKQQGQALDQVAVVVSRTQPYLALLYGEALRLELPVTWAQGVPVAYTRPGRLLRGLLEWMSSNYPVSIIYRLLAGGALDVYLALEGAALLRDSRILGGKRQTLRRLEQTVASLQAELEAAIDAGSSRADVLSGQLFVARQMKGAFDDIIACIEAAEVEDEIDLGQLGDGLAAIIDKYAPVRSQLDEMAKQAISHEMAGIRSSGPTLLNTGTAIRMLVQVLEGVTVGASGPRSGHLYVAGIDDAYWCSRPVTYLAGLDASKMEGRAFQDPVLLDCEREQLNTALALQRDQQQRRLYQVAALLASRRGPVTISFPCYDVLDGRPSAPSSLLLHIYRLCSGQPGADYSQMLNTLPPPAVYIPTSPAVAIDERDWWLAQAFGPEAAGLQQTEVTTCYLGLRQGWTAWERRGDSLFTEYDGHIGAAGELDPRLNPDRIQSASSIETMAKCPFTFFLRYVLKVRPAEDMNIDNSTWLDPLQRGELLHSIYSGYQDEVYGPGKTNQPDKGLLWQIAEREIETWRQQVPPPDGLVFRLEKEDLLRGLEVYFYLLEEKHSTGAALPVYSEVPFGLGAAEVQKVGVGTAGPVEIRLPGGGSFQLRGRIDLVEKVPSGDYQIWDYKTGSTWGFNDRDFCKAGQQVQHLLYSIAAEEALGALPEQGSVTIEQAGYLFPTDKGEGRTIVRRQDRRGYGLQAVEKVLDLMGNGVFCSSPSDTYCKFCDYSLVCRSRQAVLSINIKLDDDANTCLDEWKELQRYE